MIRWYPMARATSLLGGNPIMFDLTQISSMTRSVAAYPPIVRDLETILYAIRRKNFGTRPTAELAFEVKHSRALNGLARFELVDGGQLLQAQDALDNASYWPATGGPVVAADPTVKDPLGTFNAVKVDDQSASLDAYIQQSVGVTALGKTFYGSVFVRADITHESVIDLIAGADFKAQAFQAREFWQNQSIIYSFVSSAGSAASLLLHPSPLGAPSTGHVHYFRAQMYQIAILSGTDEEILADLYDKLCSDDWSVELTLDGGLNWRPVLLQEYEKIPIDEKWIGHSLRYLMECREPIESRPPTLDGRW